MAALLVAIAGALIAVWLAFRPLDSAAWGTDIGLVRLLLLVTTLPIAVVVLVFHRVRGALSGSAGRPGCASDRRPS